MGRYVLKGISMKNYIFRVISLFVAVAIIFFIYLQSINGSSSIAALSVEITAFVFFMGYSLKGNDIFKLKIFKVLFSNKNNS